MTAVLCVRDLVLEHTIQRLHIDSASTIIVFHLHVRNSPSFNISTTLIAILVDILLEGRFRSRSTEGCFPSTLALAHRLPFPPPFTATAAFDVIMSIFFSRFRSRSCPGLSFGFGFAFQRVLLRRCPCPCNRSSPTTRRRRGRRTSIRGVHGFTHTLPIRRIVAMNGVMLNTAIGKRCLPDPLLPPLGGRLLPGGEGRVFAILHAETELQGRHSALHVLRIRRHAAQHKDRVERAGQAVLHKMRDFRVAERHVLVRVGPLVAEG